MIASLLAILTAALLLPGVIATLGFYSAGTAQGVDVVIPKMASPVGLAMIGCFAVLVHLCYAIILALVARDDCVNCWPLADPYSLFSTLGNGNKHIEAASFAWAFWGIGLQIMAAAMIGRAVGTVHASGLFGPDQTAFYGPLSELVVKTQGPNDFIVAYVVTKTETPFGLLGYRGIVESMKHDEDRYPAKLVLIEVNPFYLQFKKTGPYRKEANLEIDRIVLASADWLNVAFIPIRRVDQVL